MASEESEPSIDEKILKYEHFVNEVLRNDLKRVLNRRQLIGQQLSKFLQIKSVINGIESGLLADERPLKVMTDLGSNFYVQCVVPDCRKIYLMIGMGFCLQMDLKEAEDFIAKRESSLNEELRQLSDQSAVIRANIRLVIESIAALNGLL